MSERKHLPVGEANFSLLRASNSYYVDKTPFIYELVTKGSPRCNQLCRPRRFGKSLLLDTIKCLFEGRKELFEDTFIYDKWNWNETYPVVKIDFSDGECVNFGAYVISVSDQVEDISEKYDLEFEKRDSAALLISRIFKLLSRKTKKTISYIN